jgi:hypothetical protein
MSDLRRASVIWHTARLETARNQSRVGRLLRPGILLWCALGCCISKLVIRPARPPFALRAAMALLFLLSPFLAPQSVAPPPAPLAAAPAPKTGETLQYGVEWRMIRAGTVKLGYQAGRAGQPNQADVYLQAVGLVAKLYRVDDHYTVHLNDQYCSADVFFKAEEGNRRRETRVTFDSSRSRASYLEKDLVKNTVQTREVETPKCVHDVISALLRLRGSRLDPGQSTQFPISDGKKMVYGRVEAQEREQVKTPAGTFNTIRYEANLFNDVLYSKKGRLFVWLTDDARRLPVQVRARMQFLIGTINLQLEKIQ